MAKLTGSAIQELVDNGLITISPFSQKQLNPNSYNVKLHPKLIVYKNYELDAMGENETEELIIPNEGLLLQPGKLYLGRTVEYTETPVFIDPKTGKKIGLVPAIDGRSSFARLGISCHIAAGFGDINFKGTFTCEISCIQPVRIYPYMEIGQLYYETTIGDLDILYDGRYQGQINATESRFYIDTHN